MAVVSTVIGYVIPRPLTDVFYNGCKIYSYYRKGNKRKMRFCAEKMLETIFRTVCAAPFAFVSWQLRRLNSRPLGQIILINLFFVGSGFAIARPSFNLGVGAFRMLLNLRICSLLYSEPRNRIDFTIYCAYTLAYFAMMQLYRWSENGYEGMLDRKIQAWAHAASTRLIN